MTGYNVKTAHGTVHRLIKGATYVRYGHVHANRGTASGKALCGSLTSMAAKVVVDEPVTCEKCLSSKEVAESLDVDEAV